MSLPIRFVPEARAEFSDAAAWYERQRTGLGLDFVASVRTVLGRIADDPTRHAMVHRDVRKTAVPRFPYIVLYREEAGEILVVGVFHTSRNPGIWRGRI